MPEVDQGHSGGHPEVDSGAGWAGLTPADPSQAEPAESGMGPPPSAVPPAPTPSPSPWAPVATSPTPGGAAPGSPNASGANQTTDAGAPATLEPGAIELPSDRRAAYEPPGPYEPITSWGGPSAYQSATQPGPAGPGGHQHGPAGPGGHQHGPAGVGGPPRPNHGAPTTGGPRFNAEDLLRQRPVAPASGLRRALYRLSGRRLNLGPSSGDQARLRLLERARTPAVTGRRRIAMISLKGGVGKTTTTVMLGHTLASVRGDNVIAIDANPDAGNLASRVKRQTERSARDLLNASDLLERYADVRSYTSQADSRLEVLAGESDPALSEAFSAADYEAVLAALERFYSIVLTDCGTGILHDAMRAVLWYVDQLIVVTSPAVDSAHALGQLLDWLDQHSYHHLVQGAIVVVNGVRKRSEISVDQLAANFGSRCRGVVTVPYDAALATGGESSLDGVGRATESAYLELAATIGDGFSQPRQHGHDPGPRRS